MERFRFVLLIAALPGVGCVSVSPFSIVGAGAQFFNAGIDGNLSDDGLTLQGTNISLDSVLGLDDDETTEVLVGSLQLPGVLFSGRYFDVEYDGSNALSTNINFMDQMFTIGTTVNSEVEIEFAQLLATIGLFETPKATLVPSVAVGATVGIDYFHLEATLSSVTPIAVTVSDDIEGIVPVLGGVVVLTLPLSDQVDLFADGEVVGLAGDYDDIDGHFIDVRARLGARIFGTLQAGAGYQFYNVDIEDEDSFDADFTLEGVFIFAEIGF